MKSHQCPSVRRGECCLMWVLPERIGDIGANPGKHCLEHFLHGRGACFWEVVSITPSYGVKTFWAETGGMLLPNHSEKLPCQALFTICIGFIGKGGGVSSF
ncbi:hypothetical protein TNIN_490101 [Trichonephila inaurata madagascariensis]|uniref:Uncharacterized protein n=1 Tax=Trichonephila inaurata madagascariensis TaxID=2747483 RepID=A0A8X6IK09_9ARAC|nr:hypothetical protein TNIN_490101 [Trichonephila inaurata madagascariensis]